MCACVCGYVGVCVCVCVCVCGRVAGSGREWQGAGGWQGGWVLQVWGVWVAGCVGCVGCVGSRGAPLALHSLVHVLLELV